jgi:hypothetical protein
LIGVNHDAVARVTKMDDNAVESSARFYAILLADIHELRIACPRHLVPYMNPVDKAARGMAQTEAFGTKGLWVFQDQIDALRTLHMFYPEHEQSLVREAVEVYLKAQLRGFYAPPVSP